jgi:hypothetical protein
MPSKAQKVWPNNSQSEKLVFLVAVLGTLMFPIAICSVLTQRARICSQTKYARSQPRSPTEVGALRVDFYMRSQYVF